jgi:hypothetical protein
MLNWKRIFNERGNTLMYIMGALSVLGVSTYTIMNQNKISKMALKTVEEKKEEVLIERQIKAYLADIETCRYNFQGLAIGAPLDSIKKKPVAGTGKVIFKTGNTYNNGRIKILSMKTGSTSDPNGDFDFIFEYERGTSGNTQGSFGAKRFIKRFPMKGVTAPTITDCYLNIDGVLEDAIEQALQRVCQGPGVLPGYPTATECRIQKLMDLSIPSTTSCPPGEALRAEVSTPGLIELQCQKVINDIGNSGAGCQYGIKYDPAQPDKFDCFNLNDLVDSTPVDVDIGDDCYVGMNASTNKIQFKCGSCTVSSCSIDAADYCVGEVHHGVDNCGSICEVTGTKTTGGCSTCDPTTCNADAANTCTGEDAVGTLNCGDACTLPGTKTDPPCGGGGCDPESTNRVLVRIQIVGGFCPSTQTEYDGWLAGNHVTTFYIPDNMPHVAINGANRILSAQTAPDCHKSYKGATGTLTAGPGTFLVDPVSVQKEAGSFIPHVMIIDPDGYTYIQKCSLPGGGGGPGPTTGPPGPTTGGGGGGCPPPPSCTPPSYPWDLNCGMGTPCEDWTCANGPGDEICK